MLTREQLHAILCMRKRRVTLFSAWPRDLIRFMGQAGIDSYNPDSEISRLLHCIAYGDLQSAKNMLEVNPRLVLQASHVVTPSGLKVMHTTPLECALGAGDPEMAEMIAPYFEAKEIDGGVAVREEQYARYRTHIENMVKQEPYNFSLLLATLKQASLQDVAATLNNDMTHESALRDVLEQFRKEFTPGTINIGMHFNYQHLLHAYELYDVAFNQLRSRDNYDKNIIFCRHVIGFIQRSLPAIDRMVFAHDLGSAEMKVEIKRSFKSMNGNFDFPVTAAGLSSHAGLGFDFFVGWRAGADVGGIGNSWIALRAFRILLSHKHELLGYALRANPTYTTIARINYC